MHADNERMATGIGCVIFFMWIVAVVATIGVSVVSIWAIVQIVHWLTMK